MNLLPILFTLLTFVSTFAGGLVGLRYKDKLHLILGFTAGVLLAVVAFDIFPVIFDLVAQLRMAPISPMITLVIGFLLFHISEKLILIHFSNESEYAEHKHPTVGILSALALSVHSFLDGVGIGIGFQASTTIGLFVALAVISHDFSDGLNTVSLMIMQKNTTRRALVLLLIDAIAPVLGALSTLLFSIPDNWLVLYLGFFAGFLLYIGASEILPEAHTEHSSVGTILMTVLGTVFIFAVTRVV